MHNPTDSGVPIYKQVHQVELVRTTVKDGLNKFLPYPSRKHFLPDMRQQIRHIDFCSIINPFQGLVCDLNLKETMYAQRGIPA